MLRFQRETHVRERACKIDCICGVALIGDSVGNDEYLKPTWVEPRVGLLATIEESRGGNACDATDGQTCNAVALFS